MARKLRITLVISSLGIGGAERVMSYIANWLAGRGHDVTLILLARADMAYELAPEVRVNMARMTYTPLGAGILTRLRYIMIRFKELHPRKTILETKPDVALSFIEGNNVRVLLSTMFTRIPVIVSERTNPNIYKVPFRIQVLRRLLYPRAAAVVLQTNSLVPWTSGWLRKERVRVIPNPVPPPGCEENDGREAVSVSGTRKLVAMGRLGPEKGFDMLIDAFSRVAPRHPDWSLLILGEGRLRQNLEDQVERLGLSERVSMPGTVKRPDVKMKECDLFALTSRFEGFPNALCEAMACSLPVVSFDCGPGLSEIVRDGVDGVLVPAGDVDALASALDRLMGDEAGRKRLASRAVEIVERFGFERIMNSWESLIAEVAGRGGAPAEIHRPSGR